MTEIIQTLAGTPIPTILVIAGILFLLMSVAEKISGHLTIPETRKKQALVLGLALLVVGVALSLQSTPNSRNSSDPGVSETPSPPISPVPGVGKTPSGCDWEKFDWADIAQEQREHLSVLGWTAEIWDDDALLPATEGKDFDDLSTDEQAAARALGCSFRPSDWK